VTLALPLSSAVEAPEITPRAATDIVWLERTLGKRYRGWEQEEDGNFCVTLRRGDGRFAWCFGRTLEKALAVARQKVKGGAR
jgi:hypothetical protein